MKTYGLIGYPLEHSFSKKFFDQKFRSLGIVDQVEYRNFEIASVDLFPDIVHAHSGLFGLNVTRPYKILIIPYLTSLSGDAIGTNSVNTIRIERDSSGNVVSMRGYNTDVTGFKRTLEPLLKPWHTGALVLGNGGAARAVTFVLNQLRLPFIVVTRKKQDNTVVYSNIDRTMLESHPVIINTTPAGTFPEVNHCPNIPYHLLHKQNLLYDLVYNPEETLFLRKGAESGATVKGGASMLYLQAEASWDIWNDIDQKGAHATTR